MLERRKNNRQRLMVPSYFCVYRDMVDSPAPAPLTPYIPQNESCPVVSTSTNLTVHLKYFNSSALLKLGCANREPIACQYYQAYRVFLCGMGEQPCDPPRIGVLEGGCCSTNGVPCAPLTAPGGPSSVSAGYVVLVLFLVLLVVIGLFLGYSIYHKKKYLPSFISVEFINHKKKRVSAPPEERV